MRNLLKLLILLVISGCAHFPEQRCGEVEASFDDSHGLAVKFTPVYPSLGLRYGDQGTVRHGLSIGEHGKVTKVKLLESSADPILDKAARESAWNTLYYPDYGGKYVISTIKFSLHEACVTIFGFKTFPVPQD